MSQKKKFITIVTHPGKFHVDDVYCYALLNSLYKNNKLIRTRDKSIINNADIVFDIGEKYDPLEKRYDHHQSEDLRIYRLNGEKYSAIGLVWKHFGKIYISQCLKNDVIPNILNVIWERIDKKLIRYIDNIDNGEIDHKIGGIYTLSNQINSFNKNWYEDIDNTEQFMKVSIFAEWHLRREVNREYGQIIAVDQVLRYYHDRQYDELLVMDQFLPWTRVIFNSEGEMPEIKFVVFKNNDDIWSAQAVPLKHGSLQKRVNLPRNWGGLSDKALEKASGVEGSIFCHDKLFICGNKTKEGAIKMALKALEVHKNG